MRQNLTNVTEAQLDKVDSFYVVGSTTKEGLIEGRSNVKIDLKKAISGSGKGGDADISLGKALIKVYGMWSNPDNIAESMPDKFLIIGEGGNLFSFDTTTWEEEGITPPSGQENKYIYIIPDEGSVYIKEIDAVTDNDVYVQYREVHPLVSLEKFNGWEMTNEYVSIDYGSIIQEQRTSDRFAIKYGNDIYITNVYGD